MAKCKVIPGNGSSTFGPNSCENRQHGWQPKRFDRDEPALKAGEGLGDARK